ncbi:DUF305 domain-containing protein [Mycolicibacterium pulveris]|uniref:DUF305 domain-containing protein n=1 Tax=Mycolicibacterium pulveris TaxID=36813 RepID=UPI003CF501FE
MMSIATRIIAVFAALATALLLSSCSQSESADGHTGHQQPDTPAITGEPAGYNAEDVAFATNMIPHHEQAIELSAMVPDRSTNPELIALAEQISATQQPEINTLRVFLVQWNENPDAATGEGHAHHGDMQGMVDEATMAQLRSLSGQEFDTLWLESMISHHEGAVDMARAEVANGENVDAKRMAQTMIDTQQAEITQMQQMLRGPNG